MAGSKPQPFVDPAKAHTCGYCSNPKLREFIDGGLNAAREQGLPRPKIATVQRYIEEAGFKTGTSALGIWLRDCCKPWNKWPGGSGD
jgi:hypothetical protein